IGVWLRPPIGRAASLQPFMARLDGIVPADAPLYAIFTPDVGLRFYAPRRLEPWRASSRGPAYLLLWEDERKRWRDEHGKPLEPLAGSEAQQASHGAPHPGFVPPHATLRGSPGARRARPGPRRLLGAPTARCVTQLARAATSSQVTGAAGLAVERDRPTPVGGDTASVLVHAAEVRTRAEYPGAAGALVALHVLGIVVPADAAAGAVHRAQVGASLRVATVAGLAEQLDRTPIIARHAVPALHVDGAQARAARGVAPVAPRPAAGHGARRTRRADDHRREHGGRQQQSLQGRVQAHHFLRLPGSSTGRRCDPEWIERT